MILYLINFTYWVHVLQDGDGKISYQEFLYSELNIFLTLDTDADHKASAEEMKAFKSFLSVPGEVEKYIEYFDMENDEGEKDGQIHWNEYPSLTTTYIIIDTDANGKLDESELHAYLSLNPELSDEQRRLMVSGMLDKKDTDRDGVVTWDEFKPPRPVKEEKEEL